MERASFLLLTCSEHIASLILELLSSVVSLHFARCPKVAVQNIIEEARCQYNVAHQKLLCDRPTVHDQAPASGLDNLWL